MANQEKPKRKQLSAQDWLLAAIVAMAQGGVDNVKVERLAKQLGTSKGSFYWHFKDRKDLLDQLIRYWVEQGTNAVMAANEAAGNSPQAKLHSLLQVALDEPVGTLSSAQGEMAIRGWAMIDPHIREIVSQTEQTRIQYVSTLLQAAGLNAAEAHRGAEQLYLLLLGFFARASYAPDTADSARQAVLDHLTATMNMAAK
ncbi:TetR/AcrR family transcriptional regulator [Maritalea mediterranea]|uniref:TetR/AcrR family transcriptional regulator n=1 Tax=Maritalea mediterranea TaxID=2909667 RepID=A0ABS9E381_9HYPH|nr:TetR/AcrR family transcriptional regulator [Maritalea mediterranea]MCF4097324.1 TetR/AcrR family transcriptional regulator [Maritalea mediterranea]